MKRVFDVTISAAALIALAPVLLAVAAILYVRDGMPLVFRQQRAGLLGSVFTIYKLRTMVDGRVTPFGRWLRRTGIDELPQLWNVLRGDMSLVGPRPLLADYLPLYSAAQQRRHDVRPGLTGWAQVHGRNEVDWQEKFAMDVWYVDHQTFALDMLILFRTVVRVLHNGGGSSEAIPEFRGNA
jgi:lipopolysaccharide/colanic/teichoic acid biosynthesis glycosyltransferase